MRLYPFRTPALVRKIYPELVWREDLPQEEKQLYLTFDDGPIPEVTPWVLEVLKKENVQATFFVVGDNVKKHPYLLPRLLEEGHQVGNHTFNHLDGWRTPVPEYLENTAACQQILEEAGVKGRLFRPPYGRIKKKQIKQLSDYRIIMWDYLTGDFDPQVNAGIIMRSAPRKVRPGSIIVFHDSLKSADTLKTTLPDFIRYFKTQGFRFSVL